VSRSANHTDRHPLPRRFRPVAFLALLGLLALPLAGCEEDTGSIGQDSAYLNAPLSSNDPKEERTNLLPLKPGSWWDMHAVCAGESNEDRYVVVGPVTEGDVSGIQVDQMRKGKRWRREIFQQKGDTLYICAMQDETSQLMRYNPPIPLCKEPVSEGDVLQWYGDFRMGKETLPARALSRISGKETVTTPTGKFKTFRVDTIVQVTRGKQEVKFPTVRWLTARVGYVRRGYADKGRPAFSEVKKFNVQ
jgi:hypothetical protein